MQKELKKYFTTRPTMASHLMLEGFTGQMVPNPYNSDRPAWEFDKVDGLMDEVESYTKRLKELEGQK